MPAMIFKNDKPYLLLGAMGGEGQPQTLATIITNFFDFKLELWDSIDAPRWLFGHLPNDKNSFLYLESRVSESIIEDLTKRGHRVKLISEYSKFMGYANAILIDSIKGVIIRVADPRSDGLAVDS